MSHIYTLPFDKQKQVPPVLSEVLVFVLSKLYRSLNLIGTQAARADVHTAGSSVNHGLDALDVGLPGPVGTPV